MISPWIMLLAGCKFVDYIENLNLLMLYDVAVTTPVLIWFVSCDMLSFKLSLCVFLCVSLYVGGCDSAKWATGECF